MREILVSVSYNRAMFWKLWLTYVALKKVESQVLVSSIFGFHLILLWGPLVPYIVVENFDYSL